MTDTPRTDALVEKIKDAAQAVVDAYEQRFDSPGGSDGLFGPIDTEIVALRKALSSEISSQEK